MKKIYYLSSCDTCKRIIKELELPEDFDMQDIKNEPVTVEQLEKLKSQAGSYEALFSRRARLYKEQNLKDKNLDEEAIKELILSHYTFLKRPVILYNDHIFIGNTKKTIAAAKEVIQ